MKPILKPKPDVEDPLYGGIYKPATKWDLFVGWVWGAVLFFGLLFAAVGFLLRLL